MNSLIETLPARRTSQISAVRLILGAVVFLILVIPAPGDDWPGWMGERRDGVYRETDIVEEIPAEGLAVKWRTTIHGGYAGPAVADGRVFVFDYQRDSTEAVANDPNNRSQLTGSERLIALNHATGELLWTHAYNRPYSISYPAGPRCTPQVDGDRVYILGSEGDLKCLRVADGSVVWERNFATDLAAETPIWGYASHPLIDGDRLYTMVGGAGQGVVAFDKMTGDVLWRALDADAGYCPLSIIVAGGVHQLIAFHPAAVASLNPSDGTLYWETPIEPAYGMSIVRPVRDGDHLFASANSEAVMLRLSPDRPAVTELWRGQPKNAVYAANATPLFVGGTIYCTDDRVGSLIAVRGADGARLWQTFEATKPGETRRVKQGTAFVTRIADSDRYLIMSENGDLLMAAMTADGFRSLGRMHVVEPTQDCFGRPVVWSHPAYAGRTAYIRNDREIVAVDLSSD